MAHLTQIQSGKTPVSDRSMHPRVRLLQIVTLVWMLIELLGATLASYRSHSVALLAFGSDSLVELLSAGLVLLQFNSRIRVSRKRAAQLSGILLYLLAGIVAAMAIVSMIWGVGAKSSVLGIATTLGTLYHARPRSSETRTCRRDRRPRLGFRCSTVCNLRVSRRDNAGLARRPGALFCKMA